MIPKVIHYCWFGGNEKSKLIKKCIRSWKKYCPDYEIKEWNENNFNININDYVKEAYQEKKWAFVTDYARLWIVYNYGGIYLDTDVELIKSLNSLLDNKAFFGSEDNQYIATGLGFGAEKKNELVKKMMDEYENIHFIKEDGSYDLLPCPQRNTLSVKELLLANNFDTIIKSEYGTIYPKEYFAPLDFYTRELKKTKNTYSIHWFDASWYDTEQKKAYKKRNKNLRKDYWLHMPNRILRNILGEDRYIKLKKFLKNK